MPGPFLTTFARGYYALVGLVVGAAVVSSAWSALSNLTRGCELVFSQSDIVEPPSTGPIPGGLPACQQYVDLLPLVIGVAAAVWLLSAAVRFGHTGARSRVLVAVGAVLGVAAGGIPMAGIWWVSDYYNDAPPDALGWVIGLLPLVVGVAAAWVTWRVYGNRPAAAARASSA